MLERISSSLPSSREVAGAGGGSQKNLASFVHGKTCDDMFAHSPHIRAFSCSELAGHEIGSLT